VIMNPLAYLDKWFTTYITDRRASPQDDILTEMATQHFPDGTLPEVGDLVRIATFLFIAGHETTARLLSSALRVLAEDPDLQDTLRGNRKLLPNFVEEMLRLESPIKSDFRLTRVATALAGVDLPAGTTMMLLPGAANRDPAHFDCPEELRVDRPNARQNVAFARGVHSCPGGPLARIEGRVTIERILDRLSDVRIYPKPTTDRRTHADSTTRRCTSCAGWKRSTSSSARNHDGLRSIAELARQAGADRNCCRSFRPPSIGAIGTPSSTATPPTPTTTTVPSKDPVESSPR
jgi:cytochrome P450